MLLFRVNKLLFREMPPEKLYIILKVIKVSRYQPNWRNGEPKGATMKSVILFLLLILIGFGFLLSEYANTHQQLDSLTATQTQFQNENQQLRDQLASKDQTIAQLNQQLTQANQETSAAQAALEQMSKEKKELEERAAILSMELTGTLQENQVLHNQLAAVQEPQPSITQEQQPFLMPVTGETTEANFLPMLLVSGLPAIGLTYLLSRIRLQKRSRILMRVTEDEMETLIKMRRKR